MRPVGPEALLFSPTMDLFVAGLKEYNLRKGEAVMISALAFSGGAKTLLTILGEGTLIFIVLALQVVFPWLGRPVSTKRWILFSAVCAAVAVIVASVVQFRAIL